MPLHVSSTRAHRQEVKIVLHSLLVSSHSVGGRPVHRLRESSLNLCTGRPPTGCDDTRCCIIKFWLPDDEHIVLETCTGIY